MNGIKRRLSGILSLIAGIMGSVSDAGERQEAFWREVLIPGDDWQLLGDGYRFSEGTAVNRQGQVYFNDIQASIGYRIVGDSVEVWCPDNAKPLGQAFGPDGRELYTVSWGVPEIVRYCPDGKREVFVRGLLGNDIVCHPSGNFYMTNPPPMDADDDAVSRIWLIRGDGEPVLVHKGIQFTNGIALSPDGRLLYVNDWKSCAVYRFAVLEDGRLGPLEPFLELAKPMDQDTAGSDGMRVDCNGRIWVTTVLGIQVFDADGQALGILKGPEDRYSHLVFGGPRFDTLYLTTVNALYKRRLNVRGLNPWDPHPREQTCSTTRE